MNNDLARRLAKLGLPLFETDESVDVNKTLADTVMCDDPRLMEGFPVIAANASESPLFSLENIDSLLKSKTQKKMFRQLLSLSFAVHGSYHLTFPELTRIAKTLPAGDRTLVKKYKDSLTHNRPIKIADMILDAERIKNTFELYFEKTAEKTKQKKQRYDELSLAFALSQVFSPKQRELFNKKLEGLPLTKTEQEYYSRAVKKVVIALANDELHGLARRLLER